VSAVQDNSPLYFWVSIERLVQPGLSRAIHASQVQAKIAKGIITGSQITFLSIHFLTSQLAMLTTSRLVSFSIICPTHQQDYAMQQIETLGFDCPTNKQYDGRHSLKACSGSLDALGDKAFSCLVAFTARLHHTMKDSFGCFLPGSP
jgi:hypothetical protein